MDTVTPSETEAEAIIRRDMSKESKRANFVTPHRKIRMEADFDDRLKIEEEKFQQLKQKSHQ